MTSQRRAVDAGFKGSAILEHTCELSPMQEGMLFHSLLSGQTGVYIQQLVISLTHELNIAGFEQAWNEVTKRHEILRISINRDLAQPPSQNFHARVAIPFDWQDWTGLTNGEHNELVDAYLAWDRALGFALDQAPLMRVAVFRLAADDYRVIWTYHHALIDGRSRLLVIKDLFELYETFSLGLAVELKRARPYRDYIYWLRTLDVSKAKAFWANLLEGFTTSTRLAAGSTSPAKSPTMARGEIQANLSEDWTSSLINLANRNGLTINTVLQGAWSLLLSRYSNQEDVVFGATRACRRSIPGETDSMAGLFINTVPVRVRVSPTEMLMPWLKALRSQHLMVRDYEHTSLISIRSWSELPVGAPLFDTAVVFENWSVSSAFESLGDEWRKRHFNLIQRSNYQLLLAAYLDSGLLVRLEYDAAALEKPLVARMLAHYQNLLAGIVSDPFGPVIELAMLSRAERHQILAEWNDSRSCVYELPMMHQLFGRQALRTPDRVAAVCGEEQISFSVLDRYSNQLARLLSRRGARPEALIGVCLQRSIQMVAALLGVLKSGAAYVPLDPAYPEARIDFILGDARVGLVVSEAGRISGNGCVSFHVLDLDRAWDEIAREFTSSLDSYVSPANLAYLIYTSGSTGKPKGVAIQHSSAATFLHWAAETFESANPGAVLASTSICFDLSVYELFWPLSVGRKMVLRKSAIEIDESPAQDIELINTVPSALRELLRSGRIPTSVHVVNLAGEPLSKQLVEELYRLGHIKQVNNLYGPSEDTTYTSRAKLRVGTGAAVPIGRPIADTRMYIADDRERIVPIGAAGELYIGGHGLARGYMNRPDLTAERFVPDCFSRESGNRVYRTGDVARYLADGELEFLGRRDDQDKILGYRIEPGEIQTALAGHPEVQEAAVVVRADERGEKMLVGYIVKRDPERETDMPALRSYLKERLPEYMVPAALVVLERLPKTPNGKTDRKVLAASTLDKNKAESNYTPPRNPTEELVGGIWAEVLGLSRVDVFDNFFDAGGHSLKAAQIAFKLSNAFDINLPLSTVLDSATVARLAEAVDTVKPANRGLRVPRIERLGRDTHIPLSLAQQRLWFLDQLDPGNTAYNSTFALRLSGSLCSEAFELSVNAIIRRHESLRTSIRIIGDSAVQIITEPAYVAIPLISLELIAYDDRETLARRLMVQAGQVPFDLGRGPLIRLLLIRLDDSDHVLVLGVHHIVFDGWSLNVFMQELAAHYQAFAAGEAPRIPTLDIQYADYSGWQRRWLSADIVDEQINYWRRQLDGSTKLNLPVDFSEVGSQKPAGADRVVMMPLSLVDTLKEVSRRESVTLFMTLLAAFQVLLSRWTGQVDIAVGTPVAGRNRGELEGLIGFFVNTLVLRTDLSGDPTVTELLDRVRKTALDAYANQVVTFERVVQALNPKTLGGPPFFRVMFGLRTELDHLNIRGLHINRVRVKNANVKFDLSLGMAVTDRGLATSLRYNASLFAESTISRLLRELRSLLEAMVTHPESRLSKLFSVQGKNGTA